MFWDHREITKKMDDGPKEFCQTQSGNGSNECGKFCDCVKVLDGVYSYSHHVHFEIKCLRVNRLCQLK